MAAVPPAAAGASPSFPIDCPHRRPHPPQTCRLRHSARSRGSGSFTFGSSRLDSATFPAAFHGPGFRSASSISSVCEVAVDSSSSPASFADQKPEVHASDEQEVEPVKKNAGNAKTSVSSFMADVADLVKLVDSRDIVELELKHSDYEIMIRKKEALSPPASFATQAFPPPQFFDQAPYSAHNPPPPAASIAPSQPAPDRVHTPNFTASAPCPSPEHPPMLSPMAGTFYRCPGPGEPAFVKVGDEIQKGQVVCIVEAMKLMNEIEADQSGTIVDILVEDGKAVSVDTPLFLIKP